MLKRLWRSAFRYINVHVIHADDTPHRVARGIAIGVFVAMLPVFGIQMAIAFGLAAWARGNRILAMAVTWLSNPFTSPILFWLSWLLGHWILGIAGQTDPAAVKAHFDAIEQSLSQSAWSDLVSWSYWTDTLGVMGALGVELLAELWLGCVIVGVVAAIPAYYLTLVVVRRARARRAHRKAERRRLLAIKRAAANATRALTTSTKQIPIQV
jgi:uncharacterized protein (DUF2062 family)